MSDPYQPPAAGPQPGPAPLYSTQGIVMGTILGSLAAGVVMLYLNYRALGRVSLAKTVATWGAVVFVTMIAFASLLPNTAGIALLFMGVQAGIAYFLTDRLQGAAIRYHREQGGAMHSNLRAAAVGFLTGMALFFALITVTSLFMALTGNLPEAPNAGGG